MEIKKIINLTGHDITLLGSVIPAEDKVARCIEEFQTVGNFNGVEVVRRVVKETVNLPPVEAGTLLIVSSVVRAANPDRSDLVSPGGKIIGTGNRLLGCRNLLIN